MIVIDTDVLVFILRGNESIKRRFKELVLQTEGYIFITPIQIAEIYSGLRDKEKIKTEHFLESFGVIDIDRRVGEVAGVLMNRYGKSHNVTMGDSLIGAATKINRFKLWTLNKKHYPMFEEKEFYD
jgi:hypothetical protein